ncbi:MAG: GGDEF domain-containing protein [Janthinobacterium lividum]
MNELACIDGLTGVANRRRFDQEIRTTFRTARRTNKPLALLLLDVDDFKQHNDRFGHSHGDNVLRMLGQRLQQCLRAGDLLARYGGEEFAILLPETSEEDALTLANRLLRATRSFVWPREPVTVSIGVSSLSPATPDTQRLLTLADEALYAAKRAGKNRAIGYKQVYEQALSAAQTGHQTHLRIE